jgi:2-oxoisovalerate dehydrogenase E1 component
MFNEMMKIPGFERDPHGKPIIGLDAESLYAYGHLMRSTEQRILDLFSRGLLSGTTHTCIGQELCQMAVVRALGHPEDAVLSNHRNHGHFMTYAGDFVGLVAEVMGREAGVCGGYGGSQHIAFRHFHSNGVQAGMTGIGTGLAKWRRLSGSEAIVAVMIGDGTLGEGMLYEAMNLAAVWDCRVLFVVENNGIAQTTETAHTLRGSIEARGAAFGLATWRLDDADPEFCQRVADVVAQMRAAERAGMLVIDTCRLGPHSKGDDLRSESEKARIASRDPLEAMGRRIDASRRSAIEARNLAFIDEVEAAAQVSPESRFADIPVHIHAGQVEVAGFPEQPGHAQNVRVALNRALRDLLVHDSRVVLLGEDLHEPYGGAFKVTAGLSGDFAGRVISTPISEAGIVGAGIGLAMEGARPVVEIMFADFLTLCMDQIYNHAVKFPGMFDHARVPLVVRSPAGGRRGYGPTHSQNPENLLVSVPGLTVLFGSHRHNVGELLANAVLRWPNPTVFLEHKLLYGEAQDPGDYTVVPAGEDDLGADLFPTLRRGSARPDVTLVTFGGMLPLVEKAAARLEAEEELEVEIVAPALLAPLPREALLTALMDRSHVLVVEESHHQFGVSAELLAMLAESGFKGVVERLGMPPVPIASARSLERAQMPDEAAIIDRVLELL